MPTAKPSEEEPTTNFIVTSHTHLPSACRHNLGKLPFESSHRQTRSCCPSSKLARLGIQLRGERPGTGCEADRTQSGKRFASKKAQIVFRALVPGTQGVSEPVIVLPTKKEAPRPPSPPETKRPRGCAGCRRHMWNRRRRPESAPSSAPAKNLGKRRHHKTSRP